MINHVDSRSTMRIPLSIAVLSMLLSGCLDTRESYKITVFAGSIDRDQSIVSFTLPLKLRDQPFQVFDRDGQTVKFQRNIDDRVWFVLDELQAGSTINYRLVPGVSESTVTGSITLLSDAGGVTFSVADHPMFRYNADTTRLPRPDIDPIYIRGGYIHPVFTPSGALVTDDYPPNHLHHHGIWAAWTNTEIEGRTPDFWNMGAGTGTVEPVALDTLWNGPVYAGLRSRHRYVDLTASEATSVLKESWELRAYGDRGNEANYRMFDLHMTQTNITGNPLVLPEYHYGGLGFRGHRDWDGAENTFFLTSEGRDRSNGHATRARWCHIGGYVDGSFVGIAILSHPDNFEAPQPMRIHPTEPFFCFAPSAAGDWSIDPGQPYNARYRFIVSDGPPDASLLDRLWNDYATPAEVSISTN